VYVSHVKHMHFFKLVDGAYVVAKHKGGPLVKGDRAPIVKRYVELHLLTAVNDGLCACAASFCTGLPTYFTGEPLADYGL
jgi:hypothetical protein